MKFAEFICLDCTVTGLKSSGKEEAIAGLVNALKAKGKIKTSEHIIELLLSRERLGSTAIGNGAAIPHCSTELVEHMTGVLGISPDGVEFDSPDGKKVNIIFLLVSPAGGKSRHLDALAKISKFIKDKKKRDLLLAAASVDAVTDIMKKDA